MRVKEVLSAVCLAGEFCPVLMRSSGSSYQLRPASVSFGPTTPPFGGAPSIVNPKLLSLTSSHHGPLLLPVSDTSPQFLPPKLC